MSEQWGPLQAKKNLFVNAINSPPTISISTDFGNNIEPAQIKYVATLNDPDGLSDLDVLEIYHNGNLIDTRPITSDTAIASVEIPAAGANEDRLVARDKSGATAFVTHSYEVKAAPNVTVSSSVSGVQGYIIVGGSGSEFQIDFQEQTFTQSQGFTLKTDSLNIGNYDATGIASDTENSGNIVSDSSETQFIIPDYPNTIDISGLPNEFDENDTLRIDLTGIVSDLNIEHQDRKIVTVEILAGPIISELQDHQLEIYNTDRIFSDTQFVLRLTSTDGTTVNLEGVIRDKFGPITLSGQLQDNETDSGRPGEIKVYKVVGTDTTKIHEMLTDPNGYFSVDSLEALNDYVIKARIREGGVDNSFIRTINAQPINDEISNLIIRAVPYDGLTENGITPAQFKQHVYEVLRSGPIEKYDLSKLQVYIYETNPEPKPDSTSRGVFTQEDQDYIAAKWQDAEDIRRFFGGYPVPIIKGKDTDLVKPHNSLDELGYINSVKDNWIIIIRNDILSLAGGGSAVDLNDDGIFDHGKVIINIQQAMNENRYDFVISHESGHAAGLPGHSVAISLDQTVMAGSWPDGRPRTAKFGDLKTGLIIYDPLTIAKTPLYKILGL